MKTEEDDVYLWWETDRKILRLMVRLLEKEKERKEGVDFRQENTYTDNNE